MKYRIIISAILVALLGAIAILKQGNTDEPNTTAVPEAVPATEAPPASKFNL